MKIWYMVLYRQSKDGGWGMMLFHNLANAEAMAAHIAEKHDAETIVRHLELPS